MTEGTGASSHALSPGPADRVGVASRSRSVSAGELSLRAIAGLLALFLGLPVVFLVVRSITEGSLATAVTSPAVLDALQLSLFTTSISLVITMCFGLPLAVVLARRRFRGSGLLEAVVDLPIVLPPAVAGLGLLLVFGRRGLLGEPVGDLFGISIPFTTFAVILAQVFVSAPFFVRSARTGLGSVPTRAGGRRPCRWGRRAVPVPAHHACPSLARRWPQAW